jgi:lambda repressor-like predicted transcriptional regulator
MRGEANRRTPFLPRGTASKSAKLSEDTLAVVLRARGEVAAEVVAKLVGISRASVYNAWSGRHYTEEVSAV